MTTFEIINEEFGFFDIEAAEKRINRYLKAYPTKDIRQFAQKIKFEEEIKSTRAILITELNLTYVENEFLKEKTLSILNDERFITNYIRKSQNPFNNLKHYLDGHRFCKLYNGDFRATEIEDESIDVIVTDPPYPKEFVDLYRDLAIFAERVLKPGGSLFAMAGQSYLPEIMKLMDVDELKYNWMLCYLTPGGQSPQLWQRKVNTFWKPILWFTKGKPTKWLGDVVKSNVNDNDKNFHFWGQSFSGMNDLIQRVSDPGDVILDPFLGGGTTGVACLNNLRNFIGIELNKESYDISKDRLGQIEHELLHS